MTDRPDLIAIDGDGDLTDPGTGPYEPPPDWILPPAPRARVELTAGDWQALCAATRAGLDRLGEPWRDRIETALDEIELRAETANARWDDMVTRALHPAGNDL